MTMTENYTTLTIAREDREKLRILEGLNKRSAANIVSILINNALSPAIETIPIIGTIDSATGKIEFSQTGKKVVAVQHADGTQEIAPEFGQ